MSISEVKRAAAAGKIEARIHAQVEAIVKKETRDQKPYYELLVADSDGKLTLRAWSDSPNFSRCAEMERGGFFEFAGEFADHPAFGVEAKRWTCRTLDATEREALLAGPPGLRIKQDADYAFIVQSVEAIADPRLRSVCGLFLAEHGGRFRRAAAARNYHHARRGGLVEHTAQMMRSAEALTAVYPRLNGGLLSAGVLFHDCGKLWENPLPEEGFVMPYVEAGELLGHISIGIELVNTLWRKAAALPDAAGWPELRPASEDVRLHLLHLIAAHHGEKQFGSPIDPKTPEAFALHYIDNLDAKLEMIFTAYETSSPLAARIYERMRPLPGNLVLPLAEFEQVPPQTGEDGVSGS